MILNPYLGLLEELAKVAGPAWRPSEEVRGLRRKLVSAYAWAIPSHDAIAAMAEMRMRIVELGAGTGYWAFCLRQAGVEVKAFDANPTAPPHWVHVDAGTPESVFDSGDRAMHARALFLCWPPLGEPMAERALALFRGDVVVEIGEGPGGNTGSDAFHSLLRREWKLEREIELPRWPGASDSLRIWQR